MSICEATETRKLNSVRVSYEVPPTLSSKKDRVAGQAARRDGAEASLAGAARGTGRRLDGADAAP
jgi:hypothetical protein